MSDQNLLIPYKTTKIVNTRTVLGCSVIALLAAWSAHDVYQGITTCNTSQAAWGAVGLFPAGRIGQGIKISSEALSHIAARHLIGGAASAGKSVFSKGTDITALVRSASNVQGYIATNGNYVRTVNAGRIIGVDRTTGKATTMYTVVTDAKGALITAYPGR